MFKNHNWLEADQLATYKVYHGVEYGETKNKSIEKQDGGFEHGTTRLQVQHVNQSASVSSSLYVFVLTD